MHSDVYRNTLHQMHVNLQLRVELSSLYSACYLFNASTIVDLTHTPVVALASLTPHALCTCIFHEIGGKGPLAANYASQFYHFHRSPTATIQTIELFIGRMRQDAKFSSPTGTLLLRMQFQWNSNSPNCYLIFTVPSDPE